MRGRSRREVLLEGECLRGCRPLEELLQPCLVEPAAAEEGIDRDRCVLALASVDTHEEVAREADPARAHADPAGNLAVDERQGDGDAELPVEDVGKEAVLRIVVVLLVAAKTERFVEVPGDRVGLGLGRQGAEVAAGEGRGEIVETRDEAVDFQRAVCVARDERGAGGDVDALVGQRGELFERCGPHHATPVGADAEGNGGARAGGASSSTEPWNAPFPARLQATLDSCARSG